MSGILKRRLLTENPSGKGKVFKKQELIAEVTYELRVFQSGKNPAGHPIITGKIKPLDKPIIIWGIEQYTLHLQDGRKLDFVCVNYDPECGIGSDKGFYL